MTDMSISPAARYGADTCTGSGDAAPGPAFWLGLAAAPTFALMALWNAFFSDGPDMFCMMIQGSSPMSGMTVMYLLMSAFHLAPWLKLVAGRGREAGRS